MCALVTGVQTCALPISSFIRTVRKRAASNRRLRHRTGSADLPGPAKDSQTAEALAGSRVASWRRRAYRRWGISPRPEDVLLWWITGGIRRRDRSEEHTSELPSLMRISYAVFCLLKIIIYMNMLYPQDSVT